MILATNLDAWLDEEEQYATLEKIRRCERPSPRMALSSSARRARHRTAASRRTSRRISQTLSGIHHRRRRLIK